MCDVLMQPVRTPRPSTNLRSKPLRPTGDGGVFPRLGRLIVRRPWVVIAFWVALAGLLAPTVPSPGRDLPAASSGDSAIGRPGVGLDPADDRGIS